MHACSLNARQNAPRFLLAEQAYLNTDVVGEKSTAAAAHHIDNGPEAKSAPKFNRPK